MSGDLSAEVRPSVWVSCGMGGNSPIHFEGQTYRDPGTRAREIRRNYTYAAMKNQDRVSTGVNGLCHHRRLSMAEAWLRAK